MSDQPLYEYRLIAIGGDWNACKGQVEEAVLKLADRMNDFAALGFDLWGTLGDYLIVMRRKRDVA